MKSTVLPSLPAVLCTMAIALALVGGYITGRIQGNRDIKALEAQYAEEDKKAAEAVEKLTKDLTDQCQGDKEYILNNMHGK